LHDRRSETRDRGSNVKANKNRAVEGNGKEEKESKGSKNESKRVSAIRMEEWRVRGTSEARKVKENR
jgi:hypothetical protein